MTVSNSTTDPGPPEQRQRPRPHTYEQYQYCVPCIQDCTDDSLHNIKEKERYCTLCECILEFYPDYLKCWNLRKEQITVVDTFFAVFFIICGIILIPALLVLSLPIIIFAMIVYIIFFPTFFSMIGWYIPNLITCLCVPKKVIDNVFGTKNVNVALDTIYINKYTYFSDSLLQHLRNCATFKMTRENRYLYCIPLFIWEAAMSLILLLLYGILFTMCVIAYRVYGYVVIAYPYYILQAYKNMSQYFEGSYLSRPENQTFGDLKIYFDWIPMIKLKDLAVYEAFFPFTEGLTAFCMNNYDEHKWIIIFAIFCPFIDIFVALFLVITIILWLIVTIILYPVTILLAVIVEIVLILFLVLFVLLINICTICLPTILLFRNCYKFYDQEVV